MARRQKQSAEEPSENPNIAFVGSRDNREPFSLINNGDTTIVMPEDQSKPFFHPDAAMICKLFPWLYKPVVAK
jgi:hypothetical protein